MAKAMDLFHDGIEFIGIDAPYELRARAMALMHKVAYHAPSDARLVATLEKTASGLVAVVKVTSLSGVFLARAVGAEPVKVLNEITGNLLDQVAKWSRSR